MRPIDADELKANFPVLFEGANDLWPSGTIRRAIDNAPTIEAAPVVHGRCHICEDYDRFMEIVCYLPTESGGAITIPLNHCPNCGAKID